jgi:hypothetical protein
VAEDRVYEDLQLIPIGVQDVRISRRGLLARLVLLLPWVLFFCYGRLPVRLLVVAVDDQLVITLNGLEDFDLIGGL